MPVLYSKRDCNCRYRDVAEDDLKIREIEKYDCEQEGRCSSRRQKYFPAGENPKRNNNFDDTETVQKNEVVNTARVRRDAYEWRKIPEP